MIWLNPIWFRPNSQTWSEAALQRAERLRLQSELSQLAKKYTEWDKQRQQIGAAAKIANYLLKLNEKPKTPNTISLEELNKDFS